MPKTMAEMVAEAKGRIENLSVEQTAAERDAGALIVDLREPEERAEHGVIPGALAVPMGSLGAAINPASPEHRPELSPERRIVFHCAGGARSALAADALHQVGYTNVAHIESGFAGWQAAEQPTEDAPEAK
ncbi:MAG: rhodanese-like domain-containing protein [Chloroflexota bacterium]|nr:rhodanese-like domain-containing protein [Chloroflexota bacterium]